MRVTGKILNVFTYNEGDHLAADVPAGATELPLTFALDFEEGGGEAIIVGTDQVVTYTGYDPESMILYLDPTTPLADAQSEGTKVEMIPYAEEKRAVIEDLETGGSWEARVPHNLKPLLADGIRSRASGYENVRIESDGGEWEVAEIYGQPAVIDAEALPNIPAEKMSDGQAPAYSPAAVVLPLGVGALQASWEPVEQPDLHDPVIYDVYVSATTPVVADADHFQTSVAGTSYGFSKVRVDGIDRPISNTEPTYVAVWARDTDGLAPSLGAEGSNIPRKADIEELNVGQIHAAAVEAFRVYASQIDTDFVFASDKIQIGDPAASHIDIDPAEGLILYGTNGTTRIVTLDMTPAQLSEFTGKINTDKLAVFDSLEISGLLSRIMSAALLTIASSTINPPSSAPSLSQSTQTRAWPVPPTGFTENGIWWDGTNWRRLIYNPTTYTARVQTINASGVVTDTVTLQRDINEREARGLVVTGSNIFTIRRDTKSIGSGMFWLQKYNLDGTYVPDTAGTETLTFDSAYGTYQVYQSYTSDCVRIDSSDVVHVKDSPGKVVRRFNTSGDFLGWTQIPASTRSHFDVDDSGNYYVIVGTQVSKIDPDGNVLLQFGAGGSGNGQFISPKSIRVDSSGNIWVVDTGNDRIQKFNATGVYQAQVGTSGSGNGQLSEPASVNFDSSGNIWVVDYGNDRIQKFDSSGVFQLKFGTFDSPPGFDYPTDIAFDSAGDLWITDMDNYVIQKYSPTGTPLGVYGDFDDDDDGPYALDIDSAGNVYVVTDDTNVVTVFNSAGTEIGTFTATGAPDLGEDFMNYPAHLAHDSLGNIWVADSGTHKVKKFAPDGTWIADYGGYGSGDDQFRTPRGIAIDTSDNVYISDTFTVKKFDSSMAFQWKIDEAVLAAAGAASSTSFRPVGVATSPTGSNIYIVDQNNHRIFQFTSSGSYVRRWGSLGTSNGQFSYPEDIAVDPSGNVYVVESNNDRVQKFTSTGTYSSKFGTSGSGNTQFSSPTGIHITPAGSIYVLDNGNSRIQKFNASHAYQGTIATPADTSFTTFHGISFDASGHMYITQTGSSLARVLKYVGAYPPLRVEVANERVTTSTPGPGLGFDGTDLLVASLDRDTLDLSNISWSGLIKYNTNLVYTGNLSINSVIASGQSCTYVGVGNFDYGGPRVVLGSPTQMRVYTYSGNVITADTTYPSFTTDGTAKVIGYDGSNFYSGNDVSVLRRYSTFKATSAANRKMWAQYQWEDNSGFGTTPSPAASFSLSDRRWLNVTVPAPGAGTTRNRIFLGVGNTQPPNASMYNSGGVLATAGTVQYLGAPGSGTNPKTVSDIPTGAAGRFEAQAGTFRVNGNSEGAWHEKQATPRCFARLTAEQSIPNSTSAFTTINLVLDNTHSHAASAYWTFDDGAHTLSLNKSGFWRIDASLEWDNESGGERLMEVWNVTTGSRLAITRNAARDTGGVNDGRLTNVITKSFYLPAGTVLRMGGRQNRGSSMLAKGEGSDFGTALNVVYEGPAV
jgi:DNA-binding beta-propeller fold protein YncE